ncbi:protein translocase subunit SecF [Fuchsiella alkaliacetigena]|uniref:protein translocase subunit SecF n=1 Tax=Fuchsiella alkaliacetigena TaxID=957042 RepID=UPI00200A7481|nr:protein translocase subunit SecF [Fuchsiella alkaliacetigena]MCK8825222.1 protein translocase subunit SecF [Fuchsiella alkaliacetigena]
MSIISKDLDIIGKRKIWFLISAVIIIVGLVSMFTQGMNLGIDFTGGTIIEFAFEEEVSTDDIRVVMEEFDLAGDSIIQSSGDTGILIRTVDLEQEEISQIQNEVYNRYESAEMLRSEMVGPTIGDELTRNALLALAVAIVAIVAYISIRFQFKFAIAAIIALVHDILILLGIISLLGREINSPFIAALLTVMGYSINDTIVIFDRVRENLKYKRKQSFAELNNRAVVDTLPRSINTSATTLACIAAVFVFGGATIQTIMLALLIGILAGTYSSVFIASPALVELDAWQKRRKEMSEASV